MKNISLILLLVSTVLSSCSHSQNDGDWDDNIGLSQKKVQFHASNDSITLTTKQGGWWIAEVSLNGKSGFEQSENSEGRFIINEDEFTIIRKSPKELYIHVSSNTTGSERVLYIMLQNGDYFDHISVTQLAK